MSKIKTLKTNNMNNNTISGYKVTDKNLQCRGYQFELGKIHEENVALDIYHRGFHYCKIANDCFNYYSFDSSNRVFEVIAHGEVVDGDDKSCTNKIQLVRELTWVEVLNIVNIGKNNTGRDNTGYSNTGNRNTGYSNTGNRNTGDRNTGDRNTGNSNTGYSNTGDRNTGVFCTGVKYLLFFNKESTWTEEDFLNSKVYQLLSDYVKTKLWVPEYKMTDEEKQQNRGWKTAEGYYRAIPFKQAFQDAWNNFSEDSKQEFLTLPNFDPEIFEEITGVNVNK